MNVIEDFRKIKYRSRGKQTNYQKPTVNAMKDLEFKNSGKLTFLKEKTLHYLDSLSNTSSDGCPAAFEGGEKETPYETVETTKNSEGNDDEKKSHGSHNHGHGNGKCGGGHGHSHGKKDEKKDDHKHTADCKHDHDEEHSNKYLLNNYGGSDFGKPINRKTSQNNKESHGHSHAHGKCGGHDHKETIEILETETELNPDCCDEELNIVKLKQTPTICLLTENAAFQEKLKKGNSAMAKLKCVLIICVLFMIVEIVGGLISGSLAILTDAAHMASDIAGFGISMFSIWIARRPSST